MKKEFPGFFANGTSDIEKLWDECIFVLDANVLLSLYRYSDATRSELLQVFKALSDRLWIPNQVAYEYLTNRLAVIGEQSKIYEDAVKKIDAIRRSLENNNQHPFVSSETFDASIGIFEKLTAELNQNKSTHEKRINNDEIKDQLETLLSDKVGEAFSKDRILEIIEDGKNRYEEKIPPGYCDIKKGGNSTLFLDLCKPYGDYIVWLQLINKAKADNKPVIFITGDIKEDWWLLFNGKTIAPLPHLVEEFLSLTTQPFYMYPPDRFLERANNYLQQETSQQAVNEIRDIRTEETDNAIFDTLLNQKWPASEPLNAPPHSPWRHTLSLKLDSLSEEKDSLAHRIHDLREKLSDLTDRNNAIRKKLHSAASADGPYDEDTLDKYRRNLFLSDATTERLKKELTILSDRLTALKNQEKFILLGVSDEDIAPSKD